MRWRIVGVLLVVAACSGAETAPFELAVGPEFIQGVYPGADLVLLATVSSADDGEVVVTAEAAGADVTVTPAAIRPGEVAEVSVVPPAVVTDTPLLITVTGSRGDTEQTVVKETTIVAWTDSLETEARELFAVFAGWLEENRPELGIGPAVEASGGAVAPLLLVVSHYAFLAEDWEMGLSWHIMIPPDDWAELYLRPRDEALPTLAFRLASRQAALEDGDVEISEVAPPAEVVR